jgi:hypothetical protein
LVTLSEAVSGNLSCNCFGNVVIIL